MGTWVTVWIVLSTRLVAGQLGLEPTKDCTIPEAEAVLEACHKEFSSYALPDVDVKLKDCCTYLGAQACFQWKMIDCDYRALSGLAMLDNKYPYRYNCDRWQTECLQIPKYSETVGRLNAVYSRQNIVLFPASDRSPKSSNKSDIGPEYIGSSHNASVTHTANQTRGRSHVVLPPVNCSEPNCTKKPKTLWDFVFPADDTGVIVNGSQLYDPRTHAVGASGHPARNASLNQTGVETRSQANSTTGGSNQNDTNTEDRQAREVAHNSSGLSNHTGHALSNSTEDRQAREVAHNSSGLTNHTGHGHSNTTGEDRHGRAEGDFSNGTVLSVPLVSTIPVRHVNITNGPMKNATSSDHALRNCSAGMPDCNLTTHERGPKLFFFQPVAPSDSVTALLKNFTSAMNHTAETMKTDLASNALNVSSLNSSERQDRSFFNMSALKDNSLWNPFRTNRSIVDLLNLTESGKGNRTSGARLFPVNLANASSNSSEREERSWFNMSALKDNLWNPFRTNRSIVDLLNLTESGNKSRDARLFPLNLTSISNSSEREDRSWFNKSGLNGTGIWNVFRSDRSHIDLVNLTGSEAGNQTRGTRRLIPNLHNISSNSSEREDRSWFNISGLNDSKIWNIWRSDRSIIELLNLTGSGIGNSSR